MTGRPHGSRIGAAALWFFPLRLFLVIPPKHPIIAISDNRIQNGRCIAKDFRFSTKECDNVEQLLIKWDKRSGEKRKKNQYKTSKLEN